MIAPATDQLAQQFGITSAVVMAMATSVFVLGYGELHVETLGVVRLLIVRQLLVHFSSVHFQKCTDDRACCRLQISGILVCLSKAALSRMK